MGLLFAVNLAVSLGFAVSDAYFSIYAGSIGARGLMFALAVGGYFAAKIFFSPFTGILSDRLGSGRVLVASTALYSVISLSYIFFNNLLCVLLLRIVQGIAAACFRPVVLSAAGSFAPRLRRASSMGAFDMSFYLATALGPVIGGFVRERYGFTGLFVLLFVLCSAAFICAVILCFTSATPKLTKLSDTRFQDVIKNPVVSALLAFIFGRAFCLSVLCIFLPVYLEQKLGFSSIRTGAVMSFATVVMIFFLRPMGVLADRYPKGLMVIAGGLYSGMIMLFFPSAETFGELMALCGAMGFFSAMSQPACSSMLIEEGERLGLGRTAGVFNSVLNIGFAIAPFAGSFFVSLCGIRSVFYIAGAVGMVSMAVCSYLMVSFVSVQADIQ